LTDTEACNGFGNRFVWLAIRRSKELPEPRTPDACVVASLATQIQRAVQYGRTLGEIGRTDSARDAWCAVYHDLSADRPGLAWALLGRAEAQVMRLSAVYAILDRQPQIDHVHLKASLALWQYAEASTRMIFGDSLGDPDARYDGASPSRPRRAVRLGTCPISSNVTVQRPSWSG
jgi:hypothetical protein